MSVGHMSVGWACGRARGRGALGERPSLGWDEMEAGEQAQAGRERNGRMGEWRGTEGLWDFIHEGSHSRSSAGSSVSSSSRFPGGGAPSTS
jgi:hypothetical protein